MRDLSITATDDSPAVFLKENGTVLCVQGRSTSAVAASSFRQISLWMDEFLNKSQQPDLCFEFRLEYYNTLTSRLLLDVFLKMEKMKEKGRSVSVDWFFEKYDVDLKEAGEAYSSMVKIPFRFHEI